MMGYRPEIFIRIFPRSQPVRLALFYGMLGMGMLNAKEIRMTDSTKDPRIAGNIIRHLMSEEGYMPAPYLDPNMRQANIGYGHTFYYFPQNVINESLKQKNRKQYLLSQIPKNLYENWDKEKAKQVLIADYEKHRGAAQSWLEKGGLGDNGRLVDQLGLLFFGATGGKFIKSYGATKALKTGDADALSRAASNWGRVADGAVRSYLVARRNAERNYYLGQELPVRKEAAKAPLADRVIAKKPVTKGPLARYRTDEDVEDLDTFSAEGFPSLDFDLFNDPSSASSFMQEHLGKEGKKRADEAVWRALNGNIKPMPEDFDAVTWASEYKAPSSLIARDWREDYAGRFGEIPEAKAESLEDFQSRARITEQEFLQRARGNDDYLAKYRTQTPVAPPR